MLGRKVAMINDYISPLNNQAMRGKIDERNATGQNVLYEIWLMETVNRKKRNLVDMNDLRCYRKQDGNREKERERDHTRENKQITSAVILLGC